MRRKLCQFGQRPPYLLQLGLAEAPEPSRRHVDLGLDDLHQLLVTIFGWLLPWLAA